MPYDVNQIIKERNATNWPATADEAPIPRRPGLLVPFFGLMLALILISGAEAGLEKLKVISLERSEKPALATDQGLFDQAGNSIKHWSVNFVALTDELKKSVDYHRRQINYNLLSTSLALTDKTEILGHQAVGTLSASLQATGKTISDGFQYVLSATANAGEKISNTVIKTWQSGYLVLVQTAGKIQTVGQSGSLAVADSLGEGRDLVAATSLSLAGRIGHGLSTIGDYFDIAVYNTSSYLAVIKNNWSYFLSGSRPAAANLSVDDQDILREEIKREILAELSDEFQAALGDIHQPTLVEDGDGQGIVIVPQDDGLTPEDIRRQIQAMFSDEIKVQFDQSGQAGTIRPVFKRVTGQDYIFVLTPISGR